MSNETAGTRSPDLRLLGRNVRARRRACRLTAAEVAERAGVNPIWVESLEQGRALWDSTALSRLAWALDTATPHLLAADFDPAVGFPRAGEPWKAAPGLVEMTEEECHARLSLRSVGRVSPAASEPFVLPVNYRLDGRDVVFRTKGGSLPASVEGPVAFEVDELIDTGHLGWSVLVIGDAERVRDEADRAALEEAGLTPWVGGDRPVWIRIRPRRVTGRRIARQ